MAGYLFSLPAAILILLSTVVPFVWNFVISFTDWDGVSGMKFVGFKNYASIFTTRVAKLAIRNSCIIAVVSTLLAMFLGIMIAVMIFKLSHVEGSIFRFVFYGPVLLPMTVVGLLFTFVLSPDQGLLNGILRAIGLGSFAKPWLATETLNVVMIGVVQGWKSAGTIMMLIYTALIALPGDLFEASRIEGATFGQELRMIILPLIRPTIVLSFSMMSMWSFKTYDIVMTMTNGGPGDLSIVAPLYIIQQTFANGKFGFAAAVSILFALLIMAIIMLIRKGLKGENYEY